MRSWLICVIVFLAGISNGQDQPAQGSAAAATLDEVRRLYKENSHQLAVETADRLTTETMPEQEQREALYLRSMALLNLHRYQDAKQGFDALIKSSDEDSWAGRAHWRLQPGMPPHGHSLGHDGQTTDPLRHLRRADDLLSRHKPDDLADFYRSVVFEGINSLPAHTSENREYVFSFFDRLIALLTDEKKIAEVHLQKVRQHAYVDQQGDMLAYIRGLRQIVTEFPKTDSAAQAQLLVGQYHISTNDLVAAVYELSVLSRNFPTSESAKTAEQLVKEIKQAEVLFSLPGPVLPDATVSFTLTARNTGDVRISAIPFDPVATMQAQRRTRLDLKAIDGKGTTLKSVDIKSTSDFQPTSATVQFDAPRPGAYVLKAEANGAATYQLMLVSDLAMVTKQSTGGHEFWLVNSKTGKPRAGAEVVVGSDMQTQPRWLLREEQQYFSKWTPIKADSNGFADFTKAHSTVQGQIFAIARDGNHFAFVDNLHFSYSEPGRQRNPVAYFYTDRPVYRPAQQAYWRAIVRDSKDGEYSFEEGSQYTVEIIDPRGTRLQVYEELPLSKYGTLSGEVAIPEGAPLGQYRVHIRRKGSSQYVGDGNFRVEEYKKPDYTVTVESGTDLARINEDLEARVVANYYFGAPVSDAEVKYTVRRRPRYQIFWPFGGWNPAEPDLGWFDEAPQERGPMHGSGGDIVAEGTGRTDADGVFRLKFKAEVPPEPEPRWITYNQYGRPQKRSIWPYNPWRSFDFQVEATVIDKSRRNIDGSETIVVSEKALQLGVKTERQIVSPGDVALASVTSTNMNGKPVATTGTLYVERLVWNPAAGKDDITTISTTQVEIGSSGTLLSRWRVPDGETGRMRHFLVTDDPFGGINTASADFYVAAPGTKDVHAQYQGVELIADKTNYKVGDSARLLILNEYTDSVAWYWIDTGSGNLDKRVLPLPDRTNFITVPITEAFTPNVKIHVVAVRDERIIADEVELIVPPLRQVLTVDVTPDKLQYQPGEEGEIQIRATDHEGKPVQAEFSVSMFDESVLYIAPDMRTDIRRVFYGERRQLHSQVMFSAHVPTRYRETVPENIGQFIRTRDVYWHDGSIGNFAMFRDVSFFAQETVGSGRALAAAPAAAGAPVIGNLPNVNIGDLEDPSALHKSFRFSKTVEDEAKEKTEELVLPRMRTDFRDSMFWSPSVVTDADGRATARVMFPDSLTTWKCAAVGVTADTRVGNLTTQTIVTKNLLARLEAPRFFRERDQVTISGVIHNYLSSAKEVTVSLKSGAELKELPTAERQPAHEFTVSVEAGAEKRIDWVFDVQTAGETSLTLVARTNEESDAVEKQFPVLPHGIDKFVAWNGSSQDQSSTGSVVETSGSETLITRTIQIPNERIKATSVVDITINPSLAFSIRDALPYMIEYPYGCVEQTMSRFMPAVVAMRTFQDLGIPPLPQLQEKMPAVVKAGLQRLADMQLPDGAWGWWRNDSANLQMTSYVMYGLTLCREADVQVDEAIYNRGLERLKAMLADEQKELAKDRRSSYGYNHRIHGMAYAAFVLAGQKQLDDATLTTLWEHRAELSPTGLALLGRTLHRAGRTADVEVVLRNLHNFVTRTPENRAAHWGRPNGGWYWWEDGVESTAMALMAYLEADPQNPIIDESMKWLVLNRHGRQWKSTKDTAHAVLALSSYLRARNEMAADLEVDISLVPSEADRPFGGTSLLKTVRFTKADFWSFDGHLRLRGDQIPESASGNYQLVLLKRGEGTLFYTASAEYFTLEEDIKKAGNEIYVERTYERLVRQPATSATLAAESPGRVPDASIRSQDTYVPIKPGEQIKSGDELRVTLRLKSLNDYEYLVFEDAKPAGTEPVALQSGTSYAGGLCSNMELRDQLVAFFITRLPQGEHTITYNVRAEIPGTFHTMPTKGYAMYFPPLRANSDELVLKVVDR